MKRLPFVILCLFLCVFLNAQTRNVTFKSVNESLTTVLKKIEKMGEKNILFTSSDADRYQVSATVRRKTQREALEIVLEGKPFSVVERNTYFAIQYKGKETTQLPIKGKVINENHQPLGYANVVMLSAKDKSYIGMLVNQSKTTYRSNCQCYKNFVSLHKIIKNPPNCFDRPVLGETKNNRHGKGTTIF